MGNLAWRSTSSEYRVREVEGGRQPEMRYQCRNAELWVALNAEGYWAEPDDFSDPAFRGQDDVPIRSVLSEEDAQRAIWLAMKVNRP